MVAAQQQIKQAAKNGEQQDWDDPGDFIGRVAGAVDNGQDHKQTENQGNGIKIDKIIAEFHNNGHQDSGLN